MQPRQVTPRIAHAFGKFSDGDAFEVNAFDDLALDRRQLLQRTVDGEAVEDVIENERRRVLIRGL